MIQNKGKKRIRENIHRKKLKITINTFIQTNDSSAYERI